MKWWLKCIKNYVTFEGRARRREYWMFVLFNVIFSIILGFLDAIFFKAYIIPGKMGYLGTIYGLFVFLPSLAVIVRRLHDIGRSGWWLAGYYGLAIVCGILMLVGSVMIIAGRTAGIVLSLVDLLVFFVAGIWMLVWMCRDSQPGHNAYGPNPKEDAAVAGAQGVTGETAAQPAAEPVKTVEAPAEKQADEASEKKE